MCFFCFCYLDKKRFLGASQLIFCQWCYHQQLTHETLHHQWLQHPFFFFWQWLKRNEIKRENEWMNFGCEYVRFLLGGSKRVFWFEDMQKIFDTMEKQIGSDLMQKNLHYLYFYFFILILNSTRSNEGSFLGFK